MRQLLTNSVQKNYAVISCPLGMTERVYYHFAQDDLVNWIFYTIS
jgi:hypothetical protein